MNDRYLELNCDIYLNDERFDENGNPSGGDGVVYSWQKPIKATANFNGKNHTIYGLYINWQETSAMSMFGSVYVAKNFKMLDFYVKSIKIIAPVCSYCYVEVSNVTTRGYASSGSYTSGMISGAREGALIKDCKSWTTVFGGSQAGGISEASGQAEYVNCINYGDVYGSWAMGGIIGYIGTYLEIKFINCKNYGNFYGLSNNIASGGIVGMSYGKNSNITMISCANYGKNEVDGGIIGLLEGNINLIGCKNYGTLVDDPASGELISNLRARKANTIVNIIDCEVRSQSGKPIVGNLYYGADNLPIEINMKNIIADYSNSTIAPSYFLVRAFGSLSDYAKINVDGVEIIDKRNDTNKKYLVHQLSETTEVNIKNLLLNIDYEEFNLIPFGSMKPSNELNLSSVVVCSKQNGASKNFYFGSDFSGYYVDFKTGKIGLKSMNGKGFFQGTVTEDVLKAKGFTKKTL